MWLPVVATTSPGWTPSRISEYSPSLSPMRTVRGHTEIINAYGHVLLELARDSSAAPWKLAAIVWQSQYYGGYPDVTPSPLAGEDRVG